MENVKTVLDRRDRLYDAVVSAAGRAVSDGESAARAAEAAFERLPPNCKYDAVFRTFVAATGSESLKDWCWALAADTASLRAGRPVAPGVLPPGTSEVVVQFLASARRPSRPGKADGYPVVYRVKSLVGPGAPQQFEFVWSSKYVAFFASRADGLGFRGRAHPHKPPPPGHPYRHPDTLVGMRAILEVSSGDRGVEVAGCRCPDGLRDVNRALTAMRWRDNFACPYSYEHHCQACPKGQESCPAACRPKDLEVKPCPSCGRPEAQFDPAWGPPCVECRARGKKTGP